MGSYSDSEGNRWTQQQIDRKVRQAKEQKLNEFFNTHGYYVCEDCCRNDCKPIDCSHDISVDKCKKDGKTELAWDVENITLRGRRCHMKHDKMI